MYFEELTNTETAKIMKKTNKQVSDLIYCAKKALKKSWKGGNKTDKYEKCAESLMKLGDSIIARRKRKVRIIKKIAFSLSGLCAAVLLSVSLYQIQTPTDIKQFEQKTDIIPTETTDISENISQETTEISPPLVTLPKSTTSEERISVQTATTAAYNDDSDTVQTAADTAYITEYIITEGEEAVFSEAEQPDIPVQTEPPPIEEPTEIIPVTPEIPVTPTDIPD